MPLISLLEKESQLQQQIGGALDRAVAASRDRNLESLSATLAEFDELTRRERAFAAEREHLLSALNRTHNRPRSLRDVAALPGAPAEGLMRLRTQLIARIDAVREKLRILQPLVRELGIVYSLAVAALLNGTRAAKEGAPAEFYVGGSLVNAEA
ncbi:MAG: hypothetical protein HY286_08340 [Planctomycetes bacterium]|nr:hypothetical protein [Planctomycetota bacterium]